MNYVGQENSEMAEMMPLSFIKLSSNSAMVVSVWPLTRKKTMSASASFLNYKIIPTHIYEIKKNVPAKILKRQL